MFCYRCINTFLYEKKIFFLSFTRTRTRKSRMNSKRTLDESYVSNESTKFSLKLRCSLRTRLRIKHEYGVRNSLRERANSFIYFRNFAAKLSPSKPTMPC